MSSSYHPQTDGQTERANRTITDMLRAYVSPHHDDWEQHLTAVEFAYNNSVQASTGYTPFYLMYGQNPETPLTLGQGEIADANVKDFVSRLADDLERAQTNIAAAQERQARLAARRYLYIAL
jgi:hypothetical protein